MDFAYYSHLEVYALDFRQPLQLQESERFCSFELATKTEIQSKRLILIQDLRGSDISQVETKKMVAHSYRMKKYQRRLADSLSIYLVSNKWDFAMLRMYCVYAEIHGIRPERNTIITEDFGEAIKWLVDKNSDLQSYRRDLESIL